MAVKGSVITGTSVSAEDLEITDGNIITSKKKNKYSRPDMGNYKENNNNNHKKYIIADENADLFDLIEAPLPVSGEGDFLNLAAEEFAKALKSNLQISNKNTFYLRPIAKELANLPFDVLVLYFKGFNSIILYPFILGDSVKEYTHTVFSTTTPAEYTVTLDSIYDSNVYRNIVNLFQRSYSSSSYKFLQIGALLIPRKFDYESNTHVKRLLNNAMNAIDAKVNGNNRIITSKPLSNAGLMNRIRFSKEQIVTLHNRITRSDVSIIIEATKAKKKKRNYRDVAVSDDFVDINRSIIRTDGFIDLIYGKPRGGIFNSNNTGSDRVNRYIPRFVITSIEQKQRSNTMGLTLLAIASSFMLKMNKYWALGLKRNKGRALINQWHDIGAIGYELNQLNDNEENGFPKKIITDDPSFDINELKSLVSKAFVNDLLISLDVEMAGPQIWLQTHFTQAAYTEDDHPKAATLARRANDYILQVSDEITDGEFSKLLGNGRDNFDVVYSGAEKIHLGTYEDENGELRDIRDICYRAILNNCDGKDLSHIVAWSDSFGYFGGTEGNRLAIREDMIKRMTSGRVSIEATAKRVTFNPHYLQTLVMALMTKNVNLLPMISDDSMDEDRYYAHYARYGTSVDPMKIMLLKQKGIDLDNLSNLTPQQFMFMKLLGVNPFENQMDTLMNRLGNRTTRFGDGRGYSCF